MVIWGMLSVLAALVLLQAQSHSERDLRRSFGDRAQIAASFTESYARGLVDQERGVAERELAGKQVSGRDFRRVVGLLGFEAAVLLDGGGRALRVAPDNPAVLNKDLTREYAHLRSAAGGRSAVSKVVPSAAEGIPIVAFATPYGRGPDRRVISGAFDVADTPIGSYLRNATPFAGSRVYLLDAEGAIVASNRGDLRGFNNISKVDRDLAQALGDSAGQTARDYQFASSPVAGTPWRLVISVPRAQLFEAIGGSRRYVPWLLWFGFVLGALACALLVGNLMGSRKMLRKANEDLDRLARIDSLTGLSNRRQTGEALDAAVANAQRYDQPLSVLMIDVDHFKAVNDEHGHEIGDEVLRLVAGRLQGSLRRGDLIGRWGGEEFLVLAHSAGAVEAEAVAERLRVAVCSTPVIAGGHLLEVTVSVGAATRVGEVSEELVAQADRAMYAAKDAGRDSVATSS